MNARGAPGEARIRCVLATPASTPGPVAILALLAADASMLDIALVSLCAAPVGRASRPLAIGEVRLADIAGVDRGLVARPAPDVALLMPHGGVGVVRSLLEALQHRDDIAVIPSHADLDAALWRALGARSPIDALALAHLARAPSPLAIDLLLAQHELWSRPDAASDPARDAVLRRLLHPPLVVALGPPNIGKSTLLNALARRQVAIVADEPGTTRDHVGVSIDMDGLVVRYIDTPGLREDPDPDEARARDRALALAASADLLLLCRDGASPCVVPASLTHLPALRVALRSDLGPHDLPSDPHCDPHCNPHCDPPCDVALTAPRGEGLEALVALVRERLVPQALLHAATPWTFWVP